MCTSWLTNQNVTPTYLGPGLNSFGHLTSQSLDVLNLNDVHVFWDNPYNLRKFDHAGLPARASQRRPPMPTFTLWLTLSQSSGPMRELNEQTRGSSGGMIWFLPMLMQDAGKRRNLDGIIGEIIRNYHKGSNSRRRRQKAASRVEALDIACHILDLSLDPS
ncbi:hypothetical protein RRG08_041111 [Elysia crispata]|uniref:Uncharacterized protein n=1 Tax=Elysia crispata TaxID=231223 RepID=A0AAE0XXW4_9GAST|nr:hypothetical protein RRG08_041111 [Elysia crispata]